MFRIKQQEDNRDFYTMYLPTYPTLGKPPTPRNFRIL